MSKTSGSTLEQIREMCGDLQLPESPEQIYERMVTEGGLRGAARYYGASFASYSCHRLAGRLGYANLMNMISPEGNASSIQEYVKRVRPILRTEVVDFMETNAHHFQEYVTAADKQFAKTFDWLMFMSHETSYLLRDMFEGEIIETPALMHLRVTAELFYKREDQEDDIGEAILCYELATKPYFTFASPVFFNSGHKVPNLCSCFLMSAEDSLTGIMGAMYKAALVSKATGGVGMNISSLRHSRIGHAGKSRGVIPMLQVYDKLIRYVDQTGKRNGASTVFMQAHHIDLLPFIRSTLKNANADGRLDSLNTAIMFPDLFWERLKEDGPWTLFCPAIFPGLNESFGEKYRELYLKYETMPLPKRDEEYRVRVTAREVMDTLADSQIMSGMPYVLHKDSINYCSNQVNLNSPNPLHHRVIQASNLCLEIMEQVDSEEVACCNLGQMSLKAFVTTNRRGETRFDFAKFGYVVRCMVKFLDRVIDRNHYVFQEARTSNMRHRPIGLGVSGYADMLDIMGLAYESAEADELNRKVFACMYYNAMVSSLELAIKNGPYSTFEGSPLSEGKFSFDLWRVRKAQLEPDVVEPTPVQPLEWNQEPLYVEGIDTLLAPSWDALRSLVMKHGVRNSQMLAIMPSASTSRLMGNAENTEAHQSNLYIRNFMRASAVVINPQLFGELDGQLGLWSRDVAEFMISQGGSIARLPEFLITTAENDAERQRLKEMSGELASLCSRYKTMFEIKQLKIAQQVADRHRYICQGISHNVYLEKPSRAMLKKLHMTTHRLGLKTGEYYLRENQPAESPSYARTSSRVKAFLTGPPMPRIVNHEPFPVDSTCTLDRVELVKTYMHRWGITEDIPVRRTKKDITVPLEKEKVLSVTEVLKDEHEAFTVLISKEIEVVAPSVAQGRAAATEEEGPVCRMQPGCVGCGS